MKKLFLVILISCFVIRSDAQTFANTTFRGFNVSMFIQKNDLKYLHEINVNVVRLILAEAPLMRKEPPYGYNEKTFARMDSLLDWCREYHIKVVLDPHNFPGTQSNFTTTFRDEFWTDYKWHQLIIKFWEDIAEKYKNNETIVGYDLLNEPAFTLNSVDNGPGSWNELVAKLVKAIRNKGDHHTIIIETPAGRESLVKVTWMNRVTGIETIRLPKDDNLVVSPHFYEPLPFTRQGVGNTDRFSFPGDVNGQHYDCDKLMEIAQSIVDFQKAHKNVPIYIGEFGASRFSGPDGDKYVSCLMEIFEKYHWSWTFHNFRERNPKVIGVGNWEAEASETDLHKREQVPNTPRMTMLQKYFKNNRTF